MRDPSAPPELVTALRQRLATENVVELRVRVRPGKRETRVATDALGDAELVLDVHAAPRDDRANMEVQSFLAELFGVTRAQVLLVTGRQNPHKIFEIRRT